MWPTAFSILLLWLACSWARFLFSFWRPILAILAPNCPSPHLQSKSFGILTWSTISTGSIVFPFTAFQDVLAARSKGFMQLLPPLTLNSDSLSIVAAAPMVQPVVHLGGRASADIQWMGWMWRNVLDFDWVHSDYSHRRTLIHHLKVGRRIEFQQHGRISVLGGSFKQFLFTAVVLYVETLSQLSCIWLIQFIQVETQPSTSPLSSIVHTKHQPIFLASQCFLPCERTRRCCQGSIL